MQDSRTVKLIAKEDINVWNMLQQHHLIKKGDVFTATQTNIKDNCSIYSIDIKGIQTLYDHTDVEKYFYIEQLN